MKKQEINMESLNKVIERLLNKKHKNELLEKTDDNAEIFEALINLRKKTFEDTAYALTTLIETGVSNKQREELKKYITPIIIDSLESFYKKLVNCLDGECLYTETIDFLKSLY